MNWLLVAYLLALVYLSTRQHRSRAFAWVKTAWIWLTLIPLSQFLFTLIRAVNIRDPRDLALTEIWANGFEWLFLGISMICLAGAFDFQSMKTPPTNSGNKLPE